MFFSVRWPSIQPQGLNALLEHGFWASERLLTGSSRRTIQRVIVNFCIHPFASVPRRPYRTTGILLVSAALPTSDRFSNMPPHPTSLSGSLSRCLTAAHYSLWLTELPGYTSNTPFIFPAAAYLGDSA